MIRRRYLSREHGKGHDADGREDIVTDKVIGPLVFGGIVHTADGDCEQNGGQRHHRDHRCLSQRSDRSVKQQREDLHFKCHKGNGMH